MCTQKNCAIKFANKKLCKKKRQFCKMCKEKTVPLNLHTMVQIVQNNFNTIGPNVPEKKCNKICQQCFKFCNKKTNIIVQNVKKKKCANWAKKI